MNDKLNNETKENDNELTSVESKNEEVEIEEVVAESSEQKNEEKKSSTNNRKSIKDYLSKDLFADIKRISFTDKKPSEDDRQDTLSEEYQGTFNDISENQKIPIINDGVVKMVSNRYIELYEKLIGEKFNFPSNNDIIDRIQGNLKEFLK